MGEIPHTFVSQTTQQIHTGDTNFVDVPGVSIASSKFVAGRKYLIFVSSIMGGDSVSQVFASQMLHGSTIFTESVQAFEQSNETTLPTGHSYQWFTVWTAIAGEEIKLQFQTKNSGQTVRADNTVMMVMELSEKLIENVDWFFNFNNTGRLLTGSLASRPEQAQVTFTPASNAKYLVIGYARVDVVLFTNRVRARLNHDSGATFFPATFREGEDSLETPIHFLVRPFDLLSQSNKFEIETSVFPGTGESLLENAIFILNMNKFQDAAFEYKDFGLNLTTTPVSQATVTLTPSVTGDFFALAFFLNNPDIVSPAATAMVSLNIDGSVNPVGTVVAGMGTYDSTDLPWNSIFTISNETNVSHTWDCMGRDNGDSRPDAQRVSIAVFSMQVDETPAIEVLNSQKILSTRSKHGVISKGD